MGSWLWSGKEGTIIPMEVTWFSTPKEGMAKLQTMIKTMLNVFFDWEGGFHHKYTPPSWTINEEYYLNILRGWELNKMKTASAMGNWWLATSSWQCAQSCITSLAAFWQNHPCDSAPLQPRLGAHGLWLFPKLKASLKGKRFQNVKEIQENTTGQLMEIPRKDRE